MRFVYLLLGCLMLALCAMSHRLPDNHAGAQEPAAVEGKRPKPDRPRPRPDRNHRHDDEVEPAPAPDPVPIPPRPKPEPDPNFNKVRPLPPHVGPVIPIPKPIKPGFLVWLLQGGASLIRFALVCIAAVAVAVVIFAWRWYSSRRW